MCVCVCTTIIYSGFRLFEPSLNLCNTLYETVLKEQNLKERIVLVIFY